MRYFDGYGRRLFGALLLVSAKSGELAVADYPVRWFCVRTGLDEAAYPVLFADNPCFNYAELDNHCEELVPEGQLGAIRTVLNAPIDSGAGIEEGLRRAQEAFGSGATARVRGVHGYISDPTADDDDCSVF